MAAVSEKIEAVIILFEQVDRFIGARLIAHAPGRLSALGQELQKLVHIEVLALAGLAYPRVLDVWLDAAGGTRLQGAQRHATAVVGALVIGVDAALIGMPDMVKILVLQPALRQAVVR